MAVILAITIGSMACLDTANSSDDSQTALSPTPAIDFSHCCPFSNVVLTPASFQPSISESQAISTVRDIVQKWYYPQPEDLPTFTAQATFTGEIQNKDHTKVQDLPV